MKGTKDGESEIRMVYYREDYYTEMGWGEGGEGRR